jgi:hypothetical protein
MSVALQSPFSGNKRLFEDSDLDEQQQQQQQDAPPSAAKRVRCLGSPAGRCRPASHVVLAGSHLQHGIPASAVAAVKALFPGMDEKVRACVLCGAPCSAGRVLPLPWSVVVVPAAICQTVSMRRARAAQRMRAGTRGALRHARLSPAPALTNQRRVFVCPAAGSIALQTVEGVLAECGQDIDAAIRRLTQLKLSTEQAGAGQSAAADDAAAAAAAAASANGSDQQQQDQQQDRQQAAAAPAEAASTAAVAAAAAAPDPSVPQTAEQWVDALVQEMAAAKDFADARSRAAKLLQAFEAFVSARSKDQGRLDEAARENAILKRAVQIQNAKLQELAGGAKEQELAALKGLLGQYQERSNYSLALHLQKATDGQCQPAHRPPDVF